MRPNVPMKICRLTLKAQFKSQGQASSLKWSLMQDPAIWNWPGESTYVFSWAYCGSHSILLLFVPNPNIFCKVIDAKVAKAFSSLALRLQNWDLRKVDLHSLRSISRLLFERNEMIRQVAKKKVQAHHNQVTRHWFMTTLLMSWPNIKQWQRKMNQQSVNWLILILHQVRNHKLLLILSYE